MVPLWFGIWNPASVNPWTNSVPFFVTLTLPLGNASDTILKIFAWAIVSEPTARFVLVLNVPVEFFTNILDLLSKVTTDSMVALYELPCTMFAPFT